MKKFKYYMTVFLAALMMIIVSVNSYAGEVTNASDTQDKKYATVYDTAGAAPYTDSKGRVRGTRILDKSGIATVNAGIDVLLPGGDYRITGCYDGRVTSVSDSNIKWSNEQKLIKKFAKLKKTKETDKTLITLKKCNKSQNGVYAIGLKDSKDNYIILNIENLMLMRQAKEGNIQLTLKGKTEGQPSALNNRVVSWSVKNGSKQQSFTAGEIIRISAKNDSTASLILNKDTGIGVAAVTGKIKLKIGAQVNGKKYAVKLTADSAINSITPTPEVIKPTDTPEPTKTPQKRDLSLSGNVLVITNKAEPIRGIIDGDLNMEVTKRKIADSITWGESCVELDKVSKNYITHGEYYLKYGSGNAKERKVELSPSGKHEEYKVGDLRLTSVETHNSLAVCVMTGDTYTIWVNIKCKLPSVDEVTWSKLDKVGDWIVPDDIDGDGENDIICGVTEEQIYKMADFCEKEFWPGIEKYASADIMDRLDGYGDGDGKFAIVIDGAMNEDLLDPSIMGYVSMTDIMDFDQMLDSSVFYNADKTKEQLKDELYNSGDYVEDRMDSMHILFPEVFIHHDDYSMEDIYQTIAHEATHLLQFVQTGYSMNDYISEFLAQLQSCCIVPYANGVKDSVCYSVFPSQAYEESEGQTDASLVPAAICTSHGYNLYVPLSKYIEQRARASVEKEGGTSLLSEWYKMGDGTETGFNSLLIKHTGEDFISLVNNFYLAMQLMNNSSEEIYKLPLDEPAEIWEKAYRPSKSYQVCGLIPEKDEGMNGYLGRVLGSGEMYGAGTSIMLFGENCSDIKIEGVDDDILIRAVYDPYWEKQYEDIKNGIVREAENGALTGISADDLQKDMFPKWFGLHAKDIENYIPVGIIRIN